MEDLWGIIWVTLTSKNGGLTTKKQVLFGFSITSPSNPCCLHWFDVAQCIKSKAQDTPFTPPTAPPPSPPMAPMPHPMPPRTRSRSEPPREVTWLFGMLRGRSCPQYSIPDGAAILRRSTTNLPECSSAFQIPNLLISEIEFKFLIVSGMFLVSI